MISFKIACQRAPYTPQVGFYILNNTEHIVINFFLHLTMIPAKGIILLIFLILVLEYR